MKEISSFVRARFEKKFKTIYSDGSNNHPSDDDDDEESSYNLKYDANLLLESEESTSSEDETDDMPSLSASGKSQFHGTRVVDTIPSSLSNSYFCVEIDGKKKFMHKQTACWLLTDQHVMQSSDRLKRVQQSSHEVQKLHK